MIQFQDYEKGTNCFTNLIGVEGCKSNVVPTSGVYVQNLPNVTTTLLETVLGDTDNPSGTKVALSMLRYEAESLATDIKMGMGDIGLKANTLIDAVIYGDTVKKTFVSVKNKTGYKVTKMTGGKLSCVYVRSIKVHHDLNPKDREVVVYFFDGLNTFYLNVKVNAFTDFTYIPLNCKINECLDIFIEKTDGIVFKPVDNSPTCWVKKRPNCNCEKRDVKTTGCVSVETLGACNLFTLEVDCKCCFDSILCACAKDLTNALLYKFGVAFAQRVMTAERVGKNYGLKQYFERMVTPTVMNGGKYQIEGDWVREYKKIIKNFVNGQSQYLKRIDPVCLPCGGNGNTYHYKTIIQ